MAIGDPYASLADLTAYLNLKSGTPNDLLMTWALASSSRQIERHCGRQFNQASSASARIYEPDDWEEVRVDDFFSLTDFGVVLDPGGSGDFTEALDSTEYEVTPFNGLFQGMPWPYTTIRSIGGLWFPKIEYRRRGTMQVTAQWGWPEIPDEIHQATLVMAAKAYRIKDAPLGQAGMSNFGSGGTETSPVIKVGSIPAVGELLKPYCLNHLQGG